MTAILRSATINAVRNMRSDLHIHMLLDGMDYRAAIALHRPVPNEAAISLPGQISDNAIIEIGRHPVAGGGKDPFFNS